MRRAGRRTYGELQAPLLQAPVAVRARRRVPRGRGSVGRIVDNEISKQSGFIQESFNLGVTPYQAAT